VAWIERRRNGWIARWYVDGKKTKSKYFDDKSEAQWYARTFETKPVHANELIERLTEGSQRKRRSPKMAQYARRLVESNTDLSDGTKEGYFSTISNHLDGTKMGGMPLDAIEPQDVRDLWAALSPKKVYGTDGKGARGNVYRMLAKTFNQAVKDNHIPSSPLARSSITRPSKKRATEVDPLTVDQIEALAAACTNETHRMAILVAGYVGLRGGEVGGLRVRDIDAKRCRLSVRQAVRRTRGRRVIVPPKEDSKRTLTIPCSLAEELAAYATAHSPAADGRIFQMEQGGMHDHITLNKVCQRAASKAGLGPVNFHLLRHACASLLIDSGANAKAVQRYMGHSSIEVTYDTYGHLFTDADQSLADSMEARRDEYLERIKALSV
jgi:integrase